MERDWNVEWGYRIAEETKTTERQLWREHSRELRHWSAVIRVKHWTENG